MVASSNTESVTNVRMLASLHQRITNLVRIFELFIDRIRLFVQDSLFVDAPNGYFIRLFVLIRYSLISLFIGNPSNRRSSMPSSRFLADVTTVASKPNKNR